MTPAQAEAHCAERVRAQARPRFTASLFAPEQVRHRLLALYALDLELAHIPEAAREPMIRTMRYQWWRDAVAQLPGTTRGHPILTALAAHAATPEFLSNLEQLIDGHEAGEGAAEQALVRSAARLCHPENRDTQLPDLVARAVADNDRAVLDEARRLWTPVRAARRRELPAYLPATVVDMRHPISPLALHWRMLTRALRNCF